MRLVSACDTRFNSDCTASASAASHLSSTTNVLISSSVSSPYFSATSAARTFCASFTFLLAADSFSISPRYSSKSLMKFVGLRIETVAPCLRRERWIGHGEIERHQTVAILEIRRGQGPIWLDGGLGG